MSNAIEMQKHIDLLGMPVRDRVTGYSGTVVSVAFDLYGCIQAIVHPGMDKDSKLCEPCWFDVSRLSVTGNPVMQRPHYEWTERAVATGAKGPAEKPAYAKA